MKRTSWIAASILVSAIFLSASTQAQDIKGKNFINAGVGIGTFGFSGTGGLPITVSAEHGFSDKISAGLYLGMINRNFADDIKFHYFVAGVRGSYHFNELLNVEIKKLDLYGGAALYYRHAKVKYTGGDNHEEYKADDGAIGLGIFVAGRYLITDHLGAFAELGYGISPLQLGVTIKF